MIRVMGGSTISRVGVALGLMALTVGCGVARHREPAEAEILERILPSAVQVVLEEGGRRVRSSSGVTIAARPAPEGRECFVLTAAHTFSGAEGAEVYVIFGSHAGRGVKVDAELLAEKETDSLDLALLQARSDHCTSARVQRPPVLGEWVWVVAFPWGRRVTLARGIVSQVDLDRAADRGQETRLMVDASVSYGASGAGVFEARTGGLVGVVEGYSTARVSSQGNGSPWHIDVPVPGQTFVTSLRQIHRFLEEKGYAALLHPGATSDRPAHERL
jgi:hypothetical protein